MQEALASIRGTRLSAQKARLVANEIRGLAIEKAVNFLRFSPKKAAFLVKKVLLSAIANAEHNEGLDIDDLFVKRIFVDEGMRMRRFAARAKGRSNRIEKPSCHITVVLGTKSAEKAAKQTKKDAKTAKMTKASKTVSKSRSRQGSKPKKTAEQE